MISNVIFLALKLHELNPIVRPTILATRCSVAIVTLPSLGSSSRRIWLQLGFHALGQPLAREVLRLHRRGDPPCQHPP